MCGGPGICQGDNNLHVLEGETSKCWRRIEDTVIKGFSPVLCSGMLMFPSSAPSLSRWSRPPFLPLYGYSLECSPFPWFPTGPCLVQHSIPVTLLVFPVPYPASAQFSFVSIGPDTLLCPSFPTFKPEPFPVCGVLTPSVCSCNKPPSRRPFPSFCLLGFSQHQELACTCVCVLLCADLPAWSPLPGDTSGYSGHWPLPRAATLCLQLGSG